MNSKFKNRKFRDNTNSKPKELGKFLHMCEDLVVVKLTTSDIPFPNALVLNSQKKVIGKVEEVLGPQNEVYAAVKFDSLKEKYNEDDLFYCYENKFIPKERFMVRSEVEKKKEEGDRKKQKEAGNFKRRGDSNRFRDGDRKNFKGSRDGDRKKFSNSFKGSRDGDRKKFKR